MSDSIIVSESKDITIIASTEKGDTGPQGVQGIQGIQGIQGQKGDTGAIGATGPQGIKGDTGAIGATGVNGTDGISSYQVAVNNGFTGTETQWLASLVGTKGDTGAQGVKGDTGSQGIQGIKGDTGATGPAGSNANQIQSDWNQTNTSSLDYIKNKPDVPAAQIQADWIQTNNTLKDYIKNKPTLGTSSSLDVGIANGVATLDATGTIPVTQIPASVMAVLNISKLSLMGL